MVSIHFSAVCWLFSGSQHTARARRWCFETPPSAWVSPTLQVLCCASKGRRPWGAYALLGSGERTHVNVLRF